MPLPKVDGMSLAPIQSVVVHPQGFCLRPPQLLGRDGAVAIGVLQRRQSLHFDVLLWAATGSVGHVACGHTWTHLGAQEGSSMRLLVGTFGTGGQQNAAL